MSRLPRRRLAALLFAVVVVPSAARATGCPTAVLFEPQPGATLDAGWSGIAHDEPVFGTTLHLAVSCAATEPPCGTCTVTGVAANPLGRRLRCRNDTSIACTVTTEVADCGAADRCRYQLAPPQPLGTGGLPFCAITEIDGPVAGTVHVESGAFAPAVPVRVTVHDGIFLGATLDSPIQGCPRCVGDGAPNDGIRGGSCDVGPRAGLGCDAHAESPLAAFGAVSFDCPPSSIDVSQLRTTLAFSTTPSAVTLTAASPRCDTAPVPTPDVRCFCSTCNGPGAEPCATNTDCPASGGNPGVCGGRRCLSGSNPGAPCQQSSACPGGTCGKPGEPTRPHACLDDTASPLDCLPESSARGVCAAGPVDAYCTNHPERGCLDDGDCDGVAGACQATLRPCYPGEGAIGASVTVDATASPPVDGIASPTDLGAFTCFGPTADPFLDVWGLPGLARIHQPGRLLLGDAIPSDDVAPCPPAPAACRAPVVTGKASLALVDRSPDDAKDRLQWKWSKGAATTVADFGDPLGADAYALCLYEGGELAAALSIPAGGTCGGKPCWQRRSTGFLHRSPSGGPHGITQLQLKAGVDGKAQIQAKGRGVALPLPHPGTLTATVEVQLRNRTTGLCWGAVYVPPFDRHDDTRLTDKAD